MCTGCQFGNPNKCIEDLASSPEAKPRGKDLDLVTLWIIMMLNPDLRCTTWLGLCPPNPRYIYSDPLIF